MKNTSIIVEHKDNQERILELFTSPKLVALVADANEGKSNTIYWIIKALNERAINPFNVYTYGLREWVRGEQKIFSVEQLESIRDSLIIIDEFASMFDIDDRKEKKQIEQTLRLIFHNNNVVMLAGLPENYKKFIASKLDAIIFKKSALGDFINGSRVKKVAYNYRGHELGAAVLNIPVDQALLYDGKDYHMVQIPYIPEGDTKAQNKKILELKG